MRRPVPRVAHGVGGRGGRAGGCALPKRRPIFLPLGGNPTESRGADSESRVSVAIDSDVIYTGSLLLRRRRQTSLSVFN